MCMYSHNVGVRDLHRDRARERERKGKKKLNEFNERKRER